MATKKKKGARKKKTLRDIVLPPDSVVARLRARFKK